MSDSNTTCPTPDDLRGLLDESLPAAQQAAVQQHVESCEACQTVLASLVAGTESWEAAVAHLKGDGNTPAEPGLEEAVRRIKADEGTSEPRPHSNPADFLQPSDQPGSIGRLGAYEVSEIVGQGGMGVVVKAYDPTLHRVVAVKVLAPYLAHNPQARKRFVREAQAIAAVSHDHVITIHAIDESEEQPKIVMQFVSGRSLQEKIDAEGALPLKEILRIGMQTASGLAAAHAQGLVHRDVKPSNILLENGIQRVKLTDFGLARAVDDASLTQSGVIAGTPQYMAPEQANGDAVDYRADLFSLGSVMYAMCVGHSPFRASTTMGVLKRVCHDAPRPIREVNSDIPDWLCEIVMRLLAKAPADRFQSARQVAELLEKWLAYLQQPTIVPKPQSGAFGPTPPIEPEPAASPFGAKVRSFFTSEDYANTIFFQPVTGRQFLAWWFVTMCLCAVFGLFQGIGIPEILLVAPLFGVIASFWGLLLVALIRFLWSNLVLLVRYLENRKSGKVTESPNRTTPNRSLRPEQAAIGAAILTMLFGGGPFGAAVVAVLVWNSIKYAWPATRRYWSMTSSKSNPEVRSE